MSKYYGRPDHATFAKYAADELHRYNKLLDQRTKISKEFTDAKYDDPINGKATVQLITKVFEIHNELKDIADMCDIAALMLPSQYDKFIHTKTLIDYDSYKTLFFIEQILHRYKSKYVDRFVRQANIKLKLLIQGTGEEKTGSSPQTNPVRRAGPSTTVWSDGDGEATTTTNPN